MKYKEEFIEKIRKKISSTESKMEYRNSEKDFKRERKMPFIKVVEYGLNKKGLSGKMEIIEFEELVNAKDISSPGVLKQRLKLKGEIYRDMMVENVSNFYKKHKKEVKLYKGYIVTATDGTDFEIPNTKATRTRYNELHPRETVARASISNIYDVLNNYILDTIIEKYDTTEREMAKKNYENVKKMDLPYPIIRLKDRGYVEMQDIYYSNKSNEKYVTRLKKTDFKKQIGLMSSNDEYITIPYQYDRVRYYKKTDPEFYKIMEETKEEIKIRIVKVISGKTEIILASNLSKEEMNYEEINELYKLRWEIETSYNVLKESLKIESITSSNEIIIKQDIYSQMLVCNLIQAFKNETEANINQEKYKNKMKINTNMAVGFVKKAFILILIEDNLKTRQNMLDNLSLKIEKYLIPIKPNRTAPRKKLKKNKYSINKRKSF